jgi:hypothetical protein
MMPVGAWAGSQLWILKGEQFGLLMRMATEKRFIVRAGEKPTAVLELEAAIRKKSLDIVCQRRAGLHPR